MTVYLHTTGTTGTTLAVAAKRNGTTPRHESDTAADKAWFAAYVEDRRRRGVNPLGTVYEGEDMPPKMAAAVAKLIDLGELPDNTPVTPCRNGHPQTPENLVLDHVNEPGGGRLVCRSCRCEAANRNMAARIARGENVPQGSKTHCQNGHEFTPENTEVLETRTKKGNPIRRCLTCRADPNHDPRTRRTHCRNGHEFTPENTHTTPKGHRTCKACRNDAQRRYNAKKNITEGE